MSALPFVVAVDVGGTAAKTALITADSRVLDSTSEPVGHLRGSDAIVDRIVEVCAERTRHARESNTGTLVGLGLLVPGIVDPVARVGVSSMLLGWSDVEFGDRVEQACGVPVALGHDVRAAAGAEFAARERVVDDALFVTLGTGVGATSVVHGEAVQGAHGLGGEIAHVVVEPDGPACPCGKRGCVEVIASGPALARDYETSTGVSVDARRVAELAAGGDGVARAIWQYAMSALGLAIATYCEILDPELVVLGGGLSGAGRQLLDPVAVAVHHNLGLPQHPDVELARLGASAGVLGAGRIALDAFAGAA